jgi:molecular chaperone HscC
MLISFWGNSMILGIDLGTTNSAAAYMTGEGPRLIPNALGDPLTPSVVGVDLQGEVLVGQAAKDLQVVHPERCASAFKRQMGNDWKVALADHVFTPEKLSSLVLRSLKQDAEAFLKEPIEEVVITVPAYFNEHQRKATIQAGAIAGLKVLRILNEPTAAAIAYGFHESQEEKSIVVLDLGGGTFDVSVVEMFEGMVEVRASSGDSFLGGEDFTATLAVKILEGQGMFFERVEMESPLLIARLKHLCEQAKRKLSRQEEVQVRLPGKKGELQENGPEVTVTRQQFQTWTEHILRRIELPIRRAVSDAGLSPENITEVILVGGATRMPAFVERIRTILEKEPQQRLDPDQVVAMGAAVQAGLIAKNEALNDLVVTDVAPFTLGIETCKQFGTEFRSGYMLPIIHRNTTIPISRVKRVNTVNSNQTQIDVKVFQGENRLVQHNILLGEFVVEGIPKGPPGREIDVRFTYDLNGVLEVEATIVDTQHKVTHLIARHARGMSRVQIAKAVEEMQSLKRTPREEATIRALMNRAGRVYEELPLQGQMVLGQLLDGFEQALELAERENIEQFRQAIEEFLNEDDSAVP